MNANLIFNWLRDGRFAPEGHAGEESVFLPVEISRSALIEGSPVEETTHALGGRIRIDVAPMEMDEELENIAPDLIPVLVHDLHEARLAQRNGGPNPVPRKTGRNDPCPCGSGKKYKKCCLH